MPANAVDPGFGNLERMTQDLLGVYDKQVHESIQKQGRAFETALNDVSAILRPWSTATTTYYSQTLGRQTRILNELSDLNGTIAGLPTAISRSVDKLLLPVSKLETGLSVISANIPAISTALDGAKSTITELERLAKENGVLLDQLGSTVANKGPGWDAAPTLTRVGETPAYQDFTPDYSDTLNDYVSSLADIREQIGKIKDISAEDFYPNLNDDLSVIRDYITDIANANTDEEGIDLDGFVSDIQDMVSEMSTGLVSSFVGSAVPEFANSVFEFTDGIVTGFEESIKAHSADIASQLGNIHQSLVQPNPSGEEQETYDITTLGLEPIEETLVSTREELEKMDENFNEHFMDIIRSLDKGFVKVSNTVSSTGRMQAAQSESGIGDAIKSFDSIGNDTDAISTKSTLANAALDLLGGKAKDILAGVLSFAWVKGALDTIHESTTQIMQSTGLSRKDANKMRQDVLSGIYDTYGRSTFSGEEIESAMKTAIDSGMVNAQMIQEASESMLLASKIIPGVMLDFSQGWAKTLTVSKADSQEYIEGTAEIIDDLSNNFYVSAQTLANAVDKYQASANLFSSDVKSYNKMMKAYLQNVAAEEENNIQNLGISEFLDRIAWTSVDQLTDTDYTRMATEFGVSGQELMKLRADLRGENGDEAMRQAQANMYDAVERYGDEMRKQFEAGNSEAGLVRAGNVEGLSGTELRDIMSASKDDRMQKTAEAIRKNVGTEDYSEIDEKKLAEEMANNTIEENVRNIKDSLTKDGWLADVLNKLANTGIGGGIIGGIAGVFGSALTNLAGKGLSKLIAGKLGGGALSSASGTLLGGGGAASAGGGFLAKIGSFFGKGGAATAAAGEATAAATAAGEAATVAGEAAAAAGSAAGTAATAGTGIVARLSQFFGKAGPKVTEATTKMSTAAGKMGKSAVDFTKSAGTKAGELAGKAGTKAGELGSKVAGSKFGNVLTNLMKPSNAKVAEYAATHGGLKAGAVKALGSKLNVGLAIGESVLDLGMGAHKSKEWLGREDAQASIAGGVGGLLGGSSGEGGVANAIGQSLKWATIGTAIAPGIGTAIGAVAGGIAGAIGGERISKGIDKAFTFLGDANDKFDTFMEDKLGFIGHGLTAWKNTAIDFVKNVGGGALKGAGKLFGGFKDGLSNIVHGNVKEGFSAIGSGFVEAGKSIFGGYKDAAKDIWDDWTLSAEERIAKRKKNAEDLTAQAEAAEDKLDATQQDLSQAATNTGISTGDVIRTGQEYAIFGDNTGNARHSGLSGSNWEVPSALQSEYGVARADFGTLARSQGVTGLSSADLTDAMRGGLNNAGSLEDLRQAAIAAGVTPVSANSMDAVRGPLSATPLQPISPNGDTISEPIVNALDNNMNSVVTLLAKAVNLLGDKSGGTQAPSMTSTLGMASAREPKSFGNADDMNRTHVLNFQGLA